MTGCELCRQKQKTENMVNEFIGKVFGELKVLGFAGFKPVSKNSTSNYAIVTCMCLKCKSKTDIPLTRLKTGQVRVYVNCARAQLDAGHEIVKMSAKGGSSVLGITNRAQNKNNSSGHTGVSWISSAGKWRAYINFRLKQYHLGLYDDLQDAASARKRAEKEIYGPFLEWYARTYPEQWEKIRATKSKQN